MRSGFTDWLLFIYVISLEKLRMKAITIIYPQRVMGVKGAEIICDYAAIWWVLGRSLNYDLYIYVVGWWLVVFNVPSTARSFRDGTPIYCPLRRTWSSINTPFRPGIEPRAVAWQSITLPLRYASSTVHLCIQLKSNMKIHVSSISYLLD